MRFVLLMAEPDHFDNWDRADDAHRQRVFDAFNAFAAAVRERGEIVYGDALDRTETARTVQPGPGREVTDGPYAETVEQVGGLYVIDVADHATACELAALLPQEYAVEVRPTLEVEI